jgi:hypothetical protein
MRTQSMATLAGTAMLAAAFLAPAAMAACSDRPGTPTNLSARMTSESPPTVQVSWTNTATETVFWDVEMTDSRGKVFPLPAGVGRGDTGKGLRASNSYSIPAGETRCFRVRARTARGTAGCVSQIWSGKVCATSAAPGKPTSPQSGKWGALAADGRGSWGFAVNQANEAAAKDAARRGCGNRRCTVKIAGPVGCYAYYESRANNGYWYGLALHSSGATANQVARGGCEKGAPAGTCKLVKANCGS